MSKIIDRIVRKLIKLRLQPIRVFVFHQVSDTFDPDSMWEIDWTNTEIFKSKINSLQKQGYSFISISEASKRLKMDWFRGGKYAVLTSDDGGASLRNIIPWLIENSIPLTLFINPTYTDGLHFFSRNTEKYLSREELINYVNNGKSLLTIASHGWNHINSQDLSTEDFISNCEKSEKFLKEMPGKIAFYAFPYGTYKEPELCYLQARGITPVLCDGLKNYSGSSVIHRECLDEGYSK